MKLGGLFSGVGGFELAWTQLGHEVAWMCEIDKSARKVLEEKFPGVPIYQNVEDLDPAEVEPVDVLTGGSPCQGFSVAGHRTGLEHGESRLFADYIRIMEGLADRGLKWALWENVPGVLSIQNDDGERTFEHVVAALVGGTEPVRLGQGRWNTGLADGGGRAVAWRVLDSRHFGVAQRRRRIFACVAFGDSAADRAGRALLAKSQGVPGDSASGEPSGQGAAGGVAGGVGSQSGVAHTLTGEGFDASEDGTGRGTPIVPDIAGTVSSKWAKGTGRPSGDEAQNLVAQSWGMYGPSGQEGATLEEQPSLTASHGQPGNVAVPAMLMTMREGKPGGGKGPLMVEEESLTLATGNGQTLFQPQAFDGYNQTLSDTAQTIRADKSDGDHVGMVLEPQAFRKSRRPQSNQDDETWVNDGLANTVNTFDVGDTRTTHAVVEPVTAHETGQGWWNQADHAGTLRAEGENRPSRPSNVAVMQYGVRRLTPVECERLQAFPDGWTEPAGSDSARYKAMGNAVTVNTVRWILGRMLEQS